MSTIVLVLLGIGAVALMTQRWFWLLGFGVGGLASCFAMLASITLRFNSLSVARKRFTQPYPLGFFRLVLVATRYKTRY